MRLLRILLGALTLAAPGAVPGATTALQTAPALPSRQILVMLKVPPEHLRPSAGYAGRYGDAGASTARRRTAEQIASANGFALVDGWPMPLLGVDCYVMRLSDGISVEDAVSRVSRDPHVAWSEPMEVYQGQGQATEGDPLFSVEPAARGWRLADLHKVATGRGVSVAIIDSKVEVNHPDLRGHFVEDMNFRAPDPSVAEQHGTAVAGIIGATANNGLGIAGIAPDARLMALRACWQTPSGTPTLCESLSLARALQFAIEHKANVINLSLSGPPGLLLTKLITIAMAKNATVVAAYDPTLPGGGFPASVPGVIAVADQALQSIPDNVYGAPGRDVPTTQPGGKWYLVNGTSYSVAHVSGLVALIRERRAATPLMLSRTRSGRIDACATVLRTTRACDCDCRLSEATRSTPH